MRVHSRGVLRDEPLEMLRSLDAMASLTAGHERALLTQYELDLATPGAAAIRAGARGVRPPWRPDGVSRLSAAPPRASIARMMPERRGAPNQHATRDGSL